MIEANRKIAEELIRRYSPIEKKDLNSLGFNEVSLDVNKYQHIDGEVTFKTEIIDTTISVDIKDRKSIRRGMDRNDTYLWVEIVNCYGYKGWLYGKANFIAFKQKDHWLFVWRKDLIDLVHKKVKKEYVDVFPLYKLKNRTGSKDVITLIDRNDINGIIIPRKK